MFINHLFHVFDGVDEHGFLFLSFFIHMLKVVIIFGLWFGTTWEKDFAHLLIYF